MRPSFFFVVVLSVIACSTTPVANENERAIIQEGVQFAKDGGLMVMLIDQDANFQSDATADMLVRITSSYIEWALIYDKNIDKYKFKVFPIVAPDGSIKGYNLGLRVRYANLVSARSFRIAPEIPIEINQKSNAIELVWVGRGKKEKLYCIFQVDGKEMTESIGTIDFDGYCKYLVKVPKGASRALSAFEIRQLNPIDINAWYYFYFSDIYEVSTNE